MTWQFLSGNAPEISNAVGWLDSNNFMTMLTPTGVTRWNGFIFNNFQFSSTMTSRNSSAHWTDDNGVVWIFGGLDAIGLRNDLHKLYPSVQCGPVFFPHGSIQCDSWSNQLCPILCDNPLYPINSGASARCLSSAEWKLTGSCDSMLCSPPSFHHASFSLIGMHSNESTVVSCKSGYTLNSPHAQCLPTGEWEYSGSCDASFCGTEAALVESSACGFDPIADSLPQQCSPLCAFSYKAFYACCDNAVQCDSTVAGGATSLAFNTACETSMLELPVYARCNDKALNVSNITSAGCGIDPRYDITGLNLTLKHDSDKKQYSLCSVPCSDAITEYSKCYNISRSEDAGRVISSNQALRDNLVDVHEMECAISREAGKCVEEARAVESSACGFDPSVSMPINQNSCTMNCSTTFLNFYSCCSNYESCDNMLPGNATLYEYASFCQVAKSQYPTDPSCDAFAIAVLANFAEGCGFDPRYDVFAISNSTLCSVDCASDLYAYYICYNNSGVATSDFDVVERDLSLKKLATECNNVLQTSLDCGFPDIPNVNKSLCHSTLLSNIVSCPLSCNVGYSGTVDVSCELTSSKISTEWIVGPSNVNCLGVDCETFPVLDHVNTSQCTNSRYGEDCSLSCDIGYLGNVEGFCLTTGAWNITSDCQLACSDLLSDATQTCGFDPMSPLSYTPTCAYFCSLDFIPFSDCYLGIWSNLVGQSCQGLYPDSSDCNALATTTINNFRSSCVSTLNGQVFKMQVHIEFDSPSIDFDAFAANLTFLLSQNAPEVIHNYSQFRFIEESYVDSTLILDVIPGLSTQVTTDSISTAITQLFQTNPQSEVFLDSVNISQPLNWTSHPFFFPDSTTTIDCPSHALPNSIISCTVTPKLNNVLTSSGYPLFIYGTEYPQTNLTLLTVNKTNNIYQVTMFIPSEVGFQKIFISPLNSVSIEVTAYPDQTSSFFCEKSLIGEGDGVDCIFIPRWNNQAMDTDSSRWFVVILPDSGMGSIVLTLSDKSTFQYHFISNSIPGTAQVTFLSSFDQAFIANFDINVILTSGADDLPHPLVTELNNHPMCLSSKRFSEPMAPFGFCAIRNFDDSVVCWQNLNTPIVMGMGGSFVHITCSYDISTNDHIFCGIKTDSTIYCNKWNVVYGIVGSLPMSAQHFLALDTSQNLLCAVTVEGTISCFNFVGTPFAGFVPVAQKHDPFVSVAVSLTSICGLTRSAKVVCTGLYSPTHDFLMISGGSAAMCGITSRGSVVCWSETALWLEKEGAYFHVDVGPLHYCLIAKNGTMECHCLDICTHGETIVPQSFVQKRAAFVVTGSYHTCALDEYGSPICWGSSSNNLPASTSFIKVVDSYPPDILLLDDTNDLDLADIQTCGLRSDNTISCWNHLSSSTFAFPTSNNGWLDIYPVFHAFCGLRLSGDIVCWGPMADGVNYPNTALTNGPYIGFAAGIKHYCALKFDNTTQCWGSNSNNAYIVENFVQYAKITAGPTHTCCLKASGELDCFGEFTLAGNYLYHNPALLFKDIISGPTFLTVQGSSIADYICGISFTDETLCWGMLQAQPPIDPVRAIYPGVDRVCGITNYALTCWSRYGTFRRSLSLGNSAALSEIGSSLSVLTSYGDILGAKSWPYVFIGHGSLRFRTSSVAHYRVSPSIGTDMPLCGTFGPCKTLDYALDSFGYRMLTTFSLFGGKYILNNVKELKTHLISFNQLAVSQSANIVCKDGSRCFDIKAWIDFSGCTLKDGSANTEVSLNITDRGGCILIHQHSLKLMSTSFENCTSFYGGAVATLPSTHIYTNSVKFDACKAQKQGGAVAVSISPATFVNTHCQNCSAEFGGCFHYFGYSFDLSSGKISFPLVQIDGGTFISNRALVSGGVIYHSMENGVISSATFIQNQATVSGGAIFADHSIIISNSDFDSNSAGDGGGLSVSDASQVTLTHSNFDSNMAGNIGGGFFGSKCANWIMVNCSFKNNLAVVSGGGIMFDSPLSVISLTDSLFEYNYATMIGSKGGGICLVGTKSGLLSASTLRHNRGTRGGALYFSKSNAMKIKTVTFANNTAEFGAAVYSSSSVVTTNFSTFSANDAIAGNDFYWDEIEPSADNAHLLIFGTSKLSMIWDSVSFSVLNGSLQASHVPFEQAPVFRLEDGYKHLYPTSEHIASAAIVSGSATISGTATVVYVNGVAHFDDLSILGDRNESFKIVFSTLYQGYRITADPLFLYISDCPAGTSKFGGVSCQPCPAGSFSSLESSNSSGLYCIPCMPGYFASSSKSTICSSCQPGEYQNLRAQSSCSKCPPRMYSLAPAQTKCLNCDEGMDCLNGIILVREGFWPRRTSTTISTIRCPTNFCDEGDSNGMCSANRKQPAINNVMCGECMDGYSEWAGSCVECSTTDVALVFGLIIYCWVFINILLIASQPATSGMAKIIFYFWSVCRVIVGQELNWYVIYDPLNLLTGFDKCITPLNPYQKMSLIPMVPVFIFAFMVFQAFVQYVVWPRICKPFKACVECRIRFFYTFTKFSDDPRLMGWSKAAYLRAFIALLLYSYTEISHACFKYMKCVEVGGSSVVASAPSIDCDSEKYMRWKWMVGVLFFIMVALPFFVLLFLRFSREKVASAITVSKKQEVLDLGFKARKAYLRYGFLFECYRKEYFYYEFIAIVRRICLVTIGFLFADDLSRNQTIVIFLVGTLVLHMKLMPFRFLTENIFETSLIVVTIIVAALNTGYLNSITLPFYRYWFVIVALAVSNACIAIIFVAGFIYRRKQIRESAGRNLLDIALNPLTANLDADDTKDIDHAETMLQLKEIQKQRDITPQEEQEALLMIKRQEILVNDKKKDFEDRATKFFDLKDSLA